MSKMPEIKDIQNLNDTVDMLNARCVRLVSSGKDDEAIACYDSMMSSLGPAYNMANYMKGLIFIGRGDYVRAKEYFNSSLKISPDNPAILMNMAVCEARSGKKAQAIELIKKAVAGDSKSIPTLLLGAMLCYEIDDAKDGDEYMKTATDISPTTTYTYWEVMANSILKNPNISSDKKVKLRALISENKKRIDELKINAEIQKKKKK